MTELTERTKAVFKRFIEVKLALALVKAGKDDEEQEHYCQANDFRLYFTIMRGTHCDCGNEDDIPFSGQCEDCGEGSGISLRLFYRPEKGGIDTNVYMTYTNLESDAVSVVERMKKQIDSFKSQYHFCPCGELVGGARMLPVVVAGAVGLELCDNCYIFGHEQTEEEGGACCVCLTNGGIWTKLKCGHTLHKKCFQKIKMESVELVAKKKCPLCRELSTFAHAEDPYNGTCYTGECSGDD